jgi:hypothetical protein
VSAHSYGIARKAIAGDPVGGHRRGKAFHCWKYAARLSAGAQHKRRPNRPIRIMICSRMAVMSDQFEPVSACAQIPELMPNKFGATRRERRLGQLKRLGTGQRRHVSRTNRPDKSAHAITCSDDQEVPANRAVSTKEGSTRVSSAPSRLFRIVTRTVAKTIVIFVSARVSFKRLGLRWLCIFCQVFIKFRDPFLNGEPVKID